MHNGKINKCTFLGAVILQLEENKVLHHYYTLNEGFGNKEKASDYLNEIAKNKELKEWILLTNVNYDKILKFSFGKVYARKIEIDLFNGGKIIVSILCIYNENIEECSDLQRLRLMNEELGSIIESLDDGVYVTDNEGFTLNINKAYTYITGLAKEEVIGRNVKELVQQGIFEDSSTIMALKENRTISLVQTIKGNKKVLITSNLISDQNGNIQKVVTNVRDVTKLYKLQSELQETKKLTDAYQKEIIELKQKINARSVTNFDFYFNSKIMQDVLNKVMKLADFDTTIMILGETGVGKEAIAMMLHNGSKKGKSPFITVNCNAIPESLFEAEFFGYESGSFTGANIGGKKGVFELANGGTVFLDEIGDLPLKMQGKLLRVLQQKEIIRIGGERTIKIDTRVIAATNKNLEIMVQKGEFREDLYYRLNIIPITVPPLRERQEDIWGLTYNFLREFNEKYSTNKIISEDTINVLMQYSWPGNIRELKNLIERLVITSVDEIITKDHLPINISDICNEEDLIIKVNKIIPIKTAVQKLEKTLITKAIKETGSIRRAAKKLDVHYSTISKKIKSSQDNW